MNDDINDKVVDIFNQYKNKSLNSPSNKVKFFKGFNYVRLDRDLNGRPFNEENLNEYAKKTDYIITVMRDKDGHTELYNYKVPTGRMVEFIAKFANNELDGAIIEIDKYTSKDLA